MQRKQESFTKLWHDDEWVKKNVSAKQSNLIMQAI